METLHLSTAVLEWAANKIGLGLDDLAYYIAPRKPDDFLSGKLTVAQAEKLAKKTETPFGFLFLKTPPEQQEEGIPDFRQVQNADPLSRDFYAVLKDIKKKQIWYGDYLKEIGVDKLDFVGRFKGRTALGAKVVSEDIQKTLGFSEQDRKACSTVNEFYSLLYDKIEKIGILVFKSGIVKSNSKRILSVEEFRGFAISDQLAPVIFINGKDAEAAWIFTMVHELAHIWLGESGVSDLRPGPNSDNQSTERFCNKVAAELLTPQQVFIEKWNHADVDQFDELSRYFKVSRLVIARRAADLGIINWARYNEIAAESKAKKGSGGNPYNTIPVRNSKKFTATLVGNALAGHTLFRDAARLLNIKPNTVLELGKRMAIRDQA